MKNVLVAWNEPQNKEKWSKFKRSIIECLISAEKDGFQTDEEHISFISYKERLDELVTRKDECDLLICGENFDGARIGTGTMRKWKKEHEGLNVILVLNDKKRGSTKVMELYELNYFNGLFASDFKAKYIKNLVLSKRSKEDAFTYYGLEDYIDLRKKPKTEDIAETLPEDHEEAVTENPAEEEVYESEEIAEEPPAEDETEEEEVASDAIYPDYDTLSEEDVALYRAIREAEEKAKPEKMVLPSATVVDKAQEALLAYYTKEDTATMSNLEAGLLSKEEWNHEVWEHLDEPEFSELTKEEKNEVFKKFSAFMWGQDILEPYVNDVTVSDIKCMSPDCIRIKRQGKRFIAPVRFRSKDHYFAYVSHLARRNYASLEKDLIRFVDEKSSKVAKLRTNITTEFVAARGYPIVHFRLSPKEKYNTMQLINAGMFSPKTAKYLIDAVQNKRGLIVCGQNAAGKTTLMNWALEFIPHDKSVYCIQETPELETDTHPEFVSVSPREQFIHHKRLGTEEEKAKIYTLKDLTVNSLLTDNDYIIIGEIKNEEARYFTNAAYTGSVCWASVHAQSARGALPKIADYAVSKSKDDANFSYTKEDLLQMMTSLEVVVFIERFKVKEICEVVGWDSNKREMIYKNIPVDVVEAKRRKK